jgi:hypothetical protein
MHTTWAVWGLGFRHRDRETERGREVFASSKRFVQREREREGERHREKQRQREAKGSS